MTKFKQISIQYAAQLLNLWQMNLLEPANFLVDPDKFDVNLQDLQAQLNSPYDHYFGAFNGQQLIAYCLLRQGEYLKNRHTASLEIYVRPEVREQGIGLSLCQFSLNNIRQQGVKRVTLEVWANNPSALKLYQKMGFKLEGTCHKAYKIGAKYVDSYLLAKWLA